jgi:tetratricopeptide (TPR) repeat protein
LAVKLLLIGWDAADWFVIRPLLERGLMPRLQHFLSQAVSGELQPVRPFDSAALWTSVVTGKRAMSHGVLSAVEADLSRTRIRPTMRSTLTARPVWSILSQAGYRTHAFGWPASHPAEPINGVAVSDLFAEYGEDQSVYPPRLREMLDAMRLAPTEIDAASLLTLLPRAAELNPAADSRLYVVAQFLASTASLHAAATWALEHEPWDFAAVRYSGLARLVGLFGGFYVAAQDGDDGEEADMFGGLIPNAHRFFDMLLGRLVELAGPEASVMLVSERGWAPTVAKPAVTRPNPGLLIAARPAFRDARRLDVADVCDVASTILHIFGLPPEPGTDGRVRTEALSQTVTCADASPCAVPSTGQVVNGPKSCSAEPAYARRDDDSVAHLLVLGYRDQPDEFLNLAIQQLSQERERRLAEAWIDVADYGRAAEVLERLVQSEPHSRSYRSLLAEAYFHAGQREACRRLILELQAEGLDTPLGRVALAALDLLEGSAGAVEHLRRAEAMGGASARMLEIIGRLYLALRRRADAGRALDAALALEPALATAHAARAIAYLYSADPASAERQARAALELNPQSYEAMFQLGLALAGQNRVGEAIDAHRAAVALDLDGDASAHRHLAELLERQGKHALALHHRALYERRDRSSPRTFDIEWLSED